MCKSVLEWRPGSDCLVNEVGQIVVAGGDDFVDCRGEFEPLKDVCISCLHDPLRYIALQNGFPEDSAGADIALECPYPSGVELPLDEERYPMAGLFFYLSWEKQRIVASFTVRGNALGVPSSDLRDKLAGILGVQGIELVSASTERYQGWVEVKFTCPLEMLVGEVGGVCIRVDILLRRVAWNLDPVERFHLVVMGQSDRLIGVRESETLDAKMKPNPLMTDRDKVEFAVDLMTFANSDSGGLILVGVATKKDGIGGDIIDDIRGISPDVKYMERCRRVMENYLVPPIKDLRVEIGILNEKSVLVILIPPQLKVNKPFLVRRSIVEGGKVSDKAFTLAVRDVDGKRYISAERVQEMLSASYDSDRM